MGAGRSGRRREQRKGGFATNAEADAALARMLAAVSTGEHRHDDRQTVGAYLTGWLADREADGMRPATIYVYRPARTGESTSVSE